MKKTIKQIAVCVLALLLAVGTTACGKKQEGTPPKETSLYYINSSEDEVVAEEYQFESDASDVSAVIKELLGQIAAESGDKKLLPLLPDGVRITRYSFSDEQLTLDMNEAYLDMSTSRELLARSGLVSTFTQVDGIRGVLITVDGKPLKDSYGNDVGVLTSHSFAEKSGSNVNSYQSREMTLYFTDEKGSVLLPEVRRVYFSSSEPIEKAVVEELLEGPQMKGHYPTFSSDTNLLSVLTSDNVCYVNFDKSVSNSVLSVNDEIPIYSVVNSLVTNCHVKKVQFSIEGSSNVTFKNTMDLSEQYTENMDLVQMP